MSDSQIQIPLSGGPNETVDPRQLPAGSVIAVRNAVYDADGSYQPRLGYTALSGASNPAGVRALYTSAGALFALDAPAGAMPQLWAWDAQGASWEAQDTVPPYQVSYAPMVNAASTFGGWDEAVYQGYRVLAWIDSADSLARVAVVSIASGAFALAPTVLAAGVQYSGVRAGVVGSSAILVATREGSARIDGFSLPLAPLGSLGAPVQLDAGDVVAAQAPFEVVFEASTLVLIYEHSISGTQSSLILRSFSAALALQVANSFTLAAGTHGVLVVGAAGDANNLWIALVMSASAYTTVILAVRADPSTLAVTSGPGAMSQPTNITSSILSFYANATRLGVAPLTSTSCMVVVEAQHDVTLDTETDSTRFWYALAWQSYSSGSGFVGVSSGATDCALGSAPLVDPATGACIAVLMSPPTLATMFGLEMSGGASVSTGSVNVVANGSLALCAIPTPGASIASLDLWAVAAPQIAALPQIPSPLLPPRLVPTTGGGYETVAPIARASDRTALAYVSLARATSMTPAAIVGRELYSAGMCFDGQRASEIGFAHAPPPFGQKDLSGAPTNTYQYAVTYARVDAAGNLEESAPTIGQTITSSSAPNVQLTFSMLHLTRKQRATDSGAASVYLRVYRTQALENGDNTLHLLASAPANPDSFTTDTLVLTDISIPDDVVARKAVLYTVSGELQHDAPDQIHAAVAHMNRVFGVGADGRTIWFSQTYSDGTMPAWSLLSQFSVDDAADGVTALASFYDKLLIFTRSRLYVLYGDGPSPAGTGSEWTLPPQRLSSASGCIDPRSVVQTPIGVMFQSERGLELVTPNLDVQFVGLPVSVTTAAFPVCASASMVDAESTVRFCMTTSDTFAQQQGGVLLLFDLRRQRWSMHYLSAGGAGAGAAGAPCYASSYHPSLGYVEGHNLDQYGAAQTAMISRENTTSDPTPWLDFGTYFVPLEVQTAWIKSGGLQGWQRVRRLRILLDYHDAHGLSATLDYDYQTRGEVHAESSATIASIVSGSWEQVRLTPAQGKSEALRLTLATTAPTAPQVVGSGRGGGFIGLAFEVRTAKGGYRNLGATAKS